MRKLTQYVAERGAVDDQLRSALAILHRVETNQPNDSSLPSAAWHVAAVQTPGRVSVAALGPGRQGGGGGP